MFNTPKAIEIFEKIKRIRAAHEKRLRELEDNIKAAKNHEPIKKEIEELNAKFVDRLPNLSDPRMWRTAKDDREKWWQPGIS